MPYDMMACFKLIIQSINFKSIAAFFATTNQNDTLHLAFLNYIYGLFLASQQTFITQFKYNKPIRIWLKCQRDADLFILHTISMQMRTY